MTIHAARPLRLILPAALAGAVAIALATVRPSTVSVRSVLGPSTDAFLRLRRAANVAISPDARRVAYVVEERDPPADRVNRTVYLVPIAGGKSIVLAEGRAPSWSPDSRWIVFERFEKGRTRHYRIAASGGTAVPLAPGEGDISGYAWSPNSRQLAVIVPRSAASERTNAAGVPRSVMKIIDIATNRSRSLEFEVDPADPAWSPDGQDIAFTAKENVYVVPTNGGPARIVVQRDGLDKQPTWSPDGKHIAFLSMQGQPNRRLRLSVVPSVSCGLAPCPITDLGKGFEARIGGGFRPTALTWSNDGATLYVPGLWHMTNLLYAIDVATDSVRVMTPGQEVFWSFSYSADAGTMAFLASDSASTGEVTISPIGSFQPRRLTNITPDLASWRLRPARPVRWSSSDGLPIEGLLLEPRDFVAGRRYPMIVLMEGTYGTFDLSFGSRAIADDNGIFPFQQQLFADAGYAVLMPNPRGAWGFGDEFSQKGRNDFGIGPLADIMTGVDAMVKEGIADSTRLGIVGTGYDAYRAVFALTQTTRFKAAIVDNPLYDLVSLYNANEAQWKGLLELLIGGSPESKPEEYRRISPANYASQLRTPTLVTYCNKCGFPQQGPELFAALRQNGTPTVTISVGLTPGEVAWGPKALALMLDRNLEWMRRWIPTAR